MLMLSVDPTTSLEGTTDISLIIDFHLGRFASWNVKTEEFID